MKPKNILLLIVLASCFFFFFFGGNQQASIQTIVTETHKQINNLKNFKDNLKDAEEKRLMTDEKYLIKLGFSENPRLYPKDIWTNSSLPIVVTYVREWGSEKQAIGLLRSVQHYLPNTTVLVYDLGIGQNSLKTLQNYCENGRCIVVTFDLGIFPSHVEEERLHAFRPLIIQDALNRAGAVLFLENDQRLTTGRLYQVFKIALDRNGTPGSGIIGWATQQATSSLTHPNMFDYFHTSADSFLFLRMVEATKLIVYNTKNVHNDVMLPWVQCALTQDCIFPIGAQSGGCHFNKKPQYRYSGCHGYDASALNIVLGLKFDFDSSRYTFHPTNLKKNESFFRTVSWRDAITEFLGMEENSTDATGFSREKDHPE